MHQRDRNRDDGGEPMTRYVYTVYWEYPNATERFVAKMHRVQSITMALKWARVGLARGFQIQIRQWIESEAPKVSQ